MQPNRRTSAMFLALTLTLALAVPACTMFNRTPSDTIRQFYPLVERGDTAGALRLVEIKPQLRGEIRGMLAGLRQNLASKGGIARLEILGETVTGDTAAVEVRFTFANGETRSGTEPLVRRVGRWLVAVGEE